MHGMGRYLGGAGGEKTPPGWWVFSAARGHAAYLRFRADSQGRFLTTQTCRNSKDQETHICMEMGRYLGGGWRRTIPTRVGVFLRRAACSLSAFQGRFLGTVTCKSYISTTTSPITHFNHHIPNRPPQPPHPQEHISTTT